MLKPAIRSLLFASAAFAAVAVAPVAKSAVVGPFTGSGPGSVTVSPNGSSAATFDLAYADSGFQVYSGETWSFTALAQTTGVETINYTYTGDHAYFMASASLSAFDGTSNQNLVSSGTFGPFSFSGTVTLNLTAGQNFGFTVSGINGDSSDYLTGNIHIEDVTAVPEPSTWAMMAVSGVGLAFVVRRRQQLRA